MAKTIKKHGKITLIIGLMIMLVAMYLAVPTGKAADLNNREVKISDSRPSQTGVDYDFEADESTATDLYCLKVEFCNAATGSCTAPSGMSWDSPDLGTAGDWANLTPGNWGINATDTTWITATTVVASEQLGTDGSWVFGNITNPSATTTAFARLTTYSDQDCSTGEEDSGVVAFAIIGGITVTATVAETLTFAISSMDSGTSLKSGVTTNVTSTITTLPFGELSTGSNTIGGHTLTVTTNAVGGYTATTQFINNLWIATATSSDIDNWTGTNATPTAPWAASNEYWGYTTDDPILGTGTTGRFGDNDVWAGFSATPYEVSYNDGPVSATTTKMGYQVGISLDSDAGDYTTTIVYVCTPTY